MSSSSVSTILDFTGKISDPPPPSYSFDTYDHQVYQPYSTSPERYRNSSPSSFLFFRNMSSSSVLTLLDFTEKISELLHLLLLILSKHVIIKFINLTRLHRKDIGPLPSTPPSLSFETCHHPVNQPYSTTQERC